MLHELLEASARRHPDRPAVVDGARTLTYAGLDARANQLARLLVELGIAPGDRVALYLDKSLESIVGVYGVLKAGAVYVPLDPQAPPRRAGFIARDCGVRCLLTGRGKAGRWADLLACGAPISTFVVLDAPAAEVAGEVAARVVGSDALDARTAAPMPPPAGADARADLAYILYTSGSTGDPKGVMLTHANALAFVAWAAAEFVGGPEERLASHAPLHFDLSTFDLFAAAQAGAATVLVPREASMFPAELVRFIDRERISVWYSVPSVLNMLVRRGDLGPGALPTLRTVLFAGEVFPTEPLRRLMSLLRGARFCNLYGPTETNVCTWYDVPPLSADLTEPIPIGTPLPGVHAAVVREDGAIAAAGEVGELHIGGPTVMRGYWGDAERTARGLVANPTPRRNGAHVYRTGDLVREDDDGNLRFVGRRDSQIKSRGYRIELGEVEAALHAAPGVLECAVLAVPDELITNRLVAAVVCEREMSPRELARACAQRVPAYMVPERFHFEQALPTTSTGKVDRRALAEAVAAQEAQEAAVPAASSSPAR